MRTSNYRKQVKLNKKTIKIITGAAAAAVLAFVIWFFVYFHVEYVEVMASGRYSEQEIKDMVLRGPLASNSVLAPMLYSDKVTGVPFVEGVAVKQVNRNTIAISVDEKKPVGCIPFLDCYMYFDRTGKIIESSTAREEKIPYFDGLEVSKVELNEDLSIKEASVLNTAVSLARIFEKNDLIPDHILFDEKYQITLEYGNVTVQLGKDRYLEDKMARLLAILPKINGQKGILHMESVTESVKTITFEKEVPITDNQKKPEDSDGENLSEDGSSQEPYGEEFENTGENAGEATQSEDTSGNQEEQFYDTGEEIDDSEADSGEYDENY